MGYWWSAAGHACGMRLMARAVRWFGSALVRWGEVVAGTACVQAREDVVAGPVALDPGHCSVRDEVRRGLAEIEQYLAGLDH